MLASGHSRPGPGDSSVIMREEGLNTERVCLMIQ